MEQACSWFIHSFTRSTLKSKKFFCNYPILTTDAGFSMKRMIFLPNQEPRNWSDLTHQRISCALWISYCPHHRSSFFEGFPMKQSHIGCHWLRKFLKEMEEQEKSTTHQSLLRRGRIICNRRLLPYCVSRGHGGPTTRVHCIPTGCPSFFTVWNAADPFQLSWIVKRIWYFLAKRTKSGIIDTKHDPSCFSFFHSFSRFLPHEAQEAFISHWIGRWKFFEWIGSTDLLRLCLEAMNVPTD